MEKPTIRTLDSMVSSDSCDLPMPNNINSSNDDADSLTVETELLQLYDSCRQISKNIRLAIAPNNLDNTNSSNKNKCHRFPIQGPHAFPCNETYSLIPQSPPDKWPQRPMLLRPSPDSGMKILGIRYSSSNEYIPLPGTNYCLGCTLPINNGLETPGKCLVVDFESKLFIGTVMLRIKNLCGAFEKHDKGSGIGDNFDSVFRNNASKEKESSRSTSDEGSYFHKKKRTFQAIVRGRFKEPGIPMSECITGQIFHRPAGKMPPRIVVKGAISVISHLAPQLQARMDGDCPRFLSPLVSTAQSAIANRDSTKSDATILNENREKTNNESLEAVIHEPQASHPTSLMQEMIHSGAASKAGISTSLPSDTNSITTRTKHRKKASDKLFKSSSKTPAFDTQTEYTFEFFQHLISFEDFALDFVRPVGKQPLSGVLNGQPLKFMAAQQKRDVDGGEEVMKWLWCFDIWHESLYDDAVAADGDKR